MKLEFLGTGGAMNTSSISTSFLINDTVLIDAPPAIPSAIYKLHKGINDINQILITHLHGDHYFGLPFLLVEYFLMGREEELSIYGDAKLEENVKRLIALAYPGMDYDAVIKNGRIKYYPVTDNQRIDLAGNISVTPIKARHTDVETFGFIVEDESRRIYYSADSEWFEEMDRCIEGVDYAILDATLQEDLLPGHMSFGKVKEIAERYNNKKFFAVHRSNYECEEVGNIFVPQEGSSYIL